MSSAPQVPGFDLTAPLGSGATATVWRAHRRADGLPVAVKVVRPARGRVPEALREASLLAGVRHQHVVHLYDVLPLPGEGDDGPAVALVTQLAAGGSLAQVLARRRLLSPGELVTVLQPVAGALADLHQLGVVHGDLATGNILFREDGMPLIADLGTARIAGEELLRGVGTGAGDGMVAPEVVEGFPATRESDVYQLGALARLCLVGEVPGPGFDRAPLAEVAPALPEVLVDLVDRCMAAQPEDRPDAEELAVALHAVAAPEPVEVAPDAEPGLGLTQRIRQVAQDDEAARARDEPGAHRPERVRPDGPSTSGRRLTTSAGVRAAAGLVVGALVLAMLVGVGWPVVRSWWGEDAVADGRPDPATTTHAAEPPVPATLPPIDQEPPVAATVTDQEEPAAPATTTDGEPPASATETDQGEPAARQSQRAQQTLQRLVDARAQAWQVGDVQLLDDVVAPGSPARVHEVGELGRAQDQGVRYPRVSFAVQDAEVVQEGEDRIVLAAAVRREPLEAVGPQGWLLRAPARTDRVQVELARVGERWLLWSWREEVDTVGEADG